MILNTANGYGYISEADARVIEEAVSEFKFKKVCRFLEIGTYKGMTAHGVRRFCESNNMALHYTGIDVEPNWVGSDTPPFDGAQYIIGRSDELWVAFKDESFDIVFVDGCHCINHVILDAIHYAPKVVVGGIMIFHDTRPDVQHSMKNRWVHGDLDLPIHLTAVVDAIAKIGWPNKQWVKWREAAQLDAHIDGIPIGGVTAYRKTKP